MQHIIKKQVIELKLHKKQDAFRMQHLISDHYRNDIVPVLETVFNEYCGEDDVLVLDSLEIDFGTISERDLEKTRWDEDLIAKFKVKLRESLSSLSAGKTTLRETRSMNICRQWMFYMQHGYLNWNTLGINEEWYHSFLETLAVDYSGISSLRNLILNEKNIAWRIALQHDDIFLTKLIEILTAQSQKKLALAAEEIYFVLNKVKNYQDQPLPVTDTFKKVIWQRITTISATASKDLSTGNIIAMVLHPYAGELAVSKRIQKELLSSVDVIRSILERFFESQNSQKKRRTSPDKQTGMAAKKPGKLEEAEDIKKATKTAAEAARNARDKPTGETIEDKMKASPKAAEDEQKKDEITASEAYEMMEKFLIKDKDRNENENLVNQSLSATIPEEGIFILHAGIVLVHPFLGSLFRRLQLVEDNQFINAGTRLKAVFLLHYLTTGKTTADEYDLVLCKLLCAYPVDEPLPGEIIFTDIDLAEANDMLTALIQQWSKLQNTSIDGLRQGFLQRSGKLFIKNDMPYVQVESSGIDVLLDYLPWNLSIIKLPWMQEMLRVEWR